MVFRLNHNISTQITLKKSDFITQLYRVFTYEEIQNILKQVHKEHPKATHICTAYRIHEKEQSNDDGEPAGTAGQPMMEALRKKDVSDILAIVIRYYGGIPLGASGLSRAYRSCVSDALNSAHLNPLVYVTHLSVEIPLNYADDVLNQIPKLGSLVERQFGDVLTLTLQSEHDISDRLNQITKGHIAFLSKKQLWIEKTSK